VQILNKYKDDVTNGIYIGRGSPLGNPYPITKTEPRDKVIDEYEIYLRGKINAKDPVIIKALNQLNENSKLICFCSPKRCHGEVIEKLWKQKIQKENKETSTTKHLEDKNNITKEIEMAEYNQQPQPQVEIKTFHNFSLYASTGDPKGRKARLDWGHRDGMPRITVWTNIEEDIKNKAGNIYAGMNPETFEIFLILLEKIARGQPDNRCSINNYTSFRNESGGLSEKKLVSTTLIGKDPSGIVWLSLISEGRPKIKFELRVSDYHILSKGDKTPFTESEASELEALALYKCLDKSYSSIIGRLREKTNKGGYTPEVVHTASVSTGPILEEDILF
jgi:hypothetical protein